MNIHEVLLRPMITEKSTIMADMGKYSFRVAPKANKIEIKEAVQKTFGVTVEDVNITKLKGKVKRYGPRFKKRPDIKKAVVTLKSGDKIQLIEGL